MARLAMIQSWCVIQVYYGWGILYKSHDISNGGDSTTGRDMYVYDRHDKSASNDGEGDYTQR